MCNIENKQNKKQIQKQKHWLTIYNHRQILWETMPIDDVMVWIH